MIYDICKQFRRFEVKVWSADLATVGAQRSQTYLSFKRWKPSALADGSGVAKWSKGWDDGRRCCCKMCGDATSQKFFVI